MRRIIKNNTARIGIGLCMLVLVGMPAAFAHAQLSTNLNSGPLFTVTNFAPGESATGTITVENQGSETESVYIVGHNTNDPDGLADEMRIEITEGATTHYDEPLGSFLQAFDGDIQLSDLGAGDTTSYDLTIKFLDAGITQGATLSFDICIGFEGGEFECAGTDDTNGGGGDSGDSGPSGGGGSISTFSSGGGGGFIAPQTLTIFNENETSVPPSSEVVTWNTNIPGTSQVVYGLVSGGPYTFDPDVDPGFGYPQFSSQNTSLTIDHSVELSGLIPGQTYAYRIISRENPGAAINASSERTFTVPGGSEEDTGTDQTGTGGTGGGVTGTGGTGGGDTGGGGGTGNEDEGEGDTGNTDEEEAGENNQAAAAFLGLPDGFFDFFGSSECLLTFVVGLLIIVGIWFLAQAVLGWRLTLSPWERTIRMLIFFAAGSALAIVYALIADDRCVLIPFGIVFVAVLGWLGWHIWKRPA